MSRIPSPCKGCTERYVRCHSICEKYIEYKRLHDEEKNAIREKKNKIYILNEYRSDRWKKRK